MTEPSENVKLSKKQRRKLAKREHLAAMLKEFEYAVRLDERRHLKEVAAERAEEALNEHINAQNLLAAHHIAVTQYEAAYPGMQPVSAVRKAILE